MSLDKINLVISTVCREENYLEATMKSLAEDHPAGFDQPVSLVVGSPVTAYLDHHRLRAGVTVIEMGPNAWAWIKNSNVFHRASWNYYRCLTRCDEGTRGTLIVEDDVQFARGWRVRLDCTLMALEEQYGADFVLAVYAPWTFPLHGQLYAEYPRARFFGTQAVYYTAKTRDGFAKYLKAHGLAANENGYDYLLRDYLLKADLLLLATTPSLVQHIGKKTTGLGAWHFSPNFVEDVRAEPSEQHQ